MTETQRARLPTPSHSDVLRVQSLIESCLQRYMPKPEVLQALHNQAKVDPDLSSLVWQKLEDTNPDFFKAYYLRLKLKDQVELFNSTVEQQAAQMERLHALTTSLGIGLGQQYPPHQAHAPSTLIAPPLPAESPLLQPAAAPAAVGAGGAADPHSHSSSLSNHSSFPPPAHQPSGGLMDVLPQQQDHDQQQQVHDQQQQQQQQQHQQQQDCDLQSQPLHAHHTPTVSDGLPTSTPMLQSLRCLGGSIDALDALGGVEDLTMGNQFPSSNDLIELANSQMGDLGELEHLP